MITEDDRTVLEQVADEHPRPLVFATVSGAHLYGFPSPDSDFDLRGVHLLDEAELLGLRGGTETLDRTNMRAGREIDLVTHDVAKFIRLMLKPNGYVLEQLLSPLVVQTGPAHQQLVALAQGCITRHHVRHYLGFGRNQWELFNKGNPRRIKPLLYTYRVLLTGIHLMRTGELEANLVRLLERYPQDGVPELIHRKRTGAEKEPLPDDDLPEHEAAYARLVTALEQAGDQSTLPEQPAAGAQLDQLLTNLRRQTLGA